MMPVYLPYKNTGYFSPLILDYLQQAKHLKPFYKYPPILSGFSNAIQDYNHSKINRNLLADVLISQYEGYETSDAVRNNISLLKVPTTFSITTAHQPCLFTGPLYCIYKIISVINLSNELKKSYPEHNFVPVFWMAGEDHDFREINHVHIFGKKIEWENSESGAVGRMNTQSIKKSISALAALSGDSPESKQLMMIIEKSYNNSSDFSQATKRLFNELFKEYGLIILNPDDPGLKSLFIPVLKDEIIHQKSGKIVNNTLKKLSTHYKPQAKPRSINLFYLDDGIRERIISSGDGNNFFINNSNKKFSYDALIAEIEKYPERFSPNVILRGLYQESILPNLAYIGGGSELGYWIEQKELFDYYKVNYPVLVLRNSVLLIDHSIQTKINQLTITYEDLFKDTNWLVSNLIKQKSSILSNLKHEKKQFNDTFDSVINKITAFDKSLSASALGEKKNLIKNLEKLEKKVLKSEKLKFENEVNSIKRIKERLFPENKLQERHDNIIPYYLMYGREIIKKLIRELNPLSKEFLVLPLTN